MNWWEAVVLGIVEGLTEYLPVSSTGHLILAQRLLGIAETDASIAYAICIQSGAIVAVLGLYRERMGQMVRGLAGRVGLGQPHEGGLRLFRNIVVAFLPAAVVGVLLNDWIEAKLFGLWPIVAAWFVGGAAILAMAKWRKDHGGQQVGRSLDELSWPLALAIGVVQCVAMWPGTSRSLVTIVGGLGVGLSLSAAVEFSFLLGVVTLLAATVYKLKDTGPEMLQTYSGWTMLLGAIAAWASAVLAVKWMVSYLKRHGLEVFGYYRVVLAAAVAAALLTGLLSSPGPTLPQ